MVLLPVIETSNATLYYHTIFLVQNDLEGATNTPFILVLTNVLD